MSELHIPGATPARGPTAMQVARDKEDVLVGDEIVRHRLASRVIHWTVAVFFLTALFTGMPVWSPVFGWMANLFGGLSVCRWLHAWLGVAFVAAFLVMFVAWLRDMTFDKYDRRFNVFEYMKFSDKEDPDVGKYNAGQKFFFWAAGLGALAFLLSIAFFVAIVGHIYLSTAAEPGTFRSMTRGTVTKSWARLHHPRWYKEVVGDGKDR